MTAIRTDGPVDLDTPRPLSAVRFPGTPHLATVWRWKSKGIRRQGQIVRLKTIVCGGRCFTTQRWANEFIAACNADTPASFPSDDFSQKAKSENAALKSALG